MRADARLNLQRVLSAARACSAKHGSSVTMEEVAQRAGVGMGTLYRRFSSGDALVEALYNDAGTQVFDEAAAVAIADDPWEALACWSAAYVDLLATKRTLLAELAPLLDQRPDLVEAPRRRARATFASFPERAQAAGAARADIDAADTVALLNAAMSAGRPSEAMLGIVLAGIRTGTQ